MDLEGSSLEPENYDILSKLPLELQLRVFSYFNFSELTGTVAPVCKQWLHLSRDPSLWKILRLLLCSEEPRRDRRNILKRCKWLRSLTIRSSFALDKVGTFITGFPNLRHLDLSFCKFQVSLLEAIVKSCRDIETFDLSGCCVDEVFIKPVAMLPRLRCLNVRMCKGMNNACVEIIAKNCQKLNELSIANNNGVITDEAVCKVVQYHGSTLRVLDIRGLDLTEQSICEVGKCSSLAKFAVTGSSCLTDKCLNALSSLENLNYLEITGRNVSKHTVRSFFTRKCVERLESLSICNMDMSLELIQSLDGKWRNLKHLALWGCKNLTSRGMNHLVRQCGQLRSLDLDSNPDLRGGFLCDIPEFLPNLKYLVIRTCWRVSSSPHIATLATRMPNLTIYQDNVANIVFLRSRVWCFQDARNVL